MNNNTRMPIQSMIDSISHAWGVSVVDDKVSKDGVTIQAARGHKPVTLELAWEDVVEHFGWKAVANVDKMYVYAEHFSDEEKNLLLGEGVPHHEAGTSADRKAWHDRVVQGPDYCAVYNGTHVELHTELGRLVWQLNLPSPVTFAIYTPRKRTEVYCADGLAYVVDMAGKIEATYSNFVPVCPVDPLPSAAAA